MSNDEIPDGFKMTEIGLLPLDWEVKRISEVANRIRSGGTPRRGIKEYWNGQVPFALIEDITGTELYLDHTKEMVTEKGLEESSAWIVPPGAVLLSMYATIGVTAINTIPVATNQAILAIIPNNKTDATYLAYCLRHNSRRLIAQNVQSTQKNVNKGIVENFRIPLPPLQEQRRIARALSSVREAKEKSQAVINALRELKKSLLKHLFAYGPVPFADAGRAALKETEIGLIPEEWDVVRLGDAYEITRKPRGLCLTSCEKIPFVRMENIPVEGGQIDRYEMRSPEDISSGTYFQAGDLLLAKITPCFENGKQGIVTELPTGFGIATTEVIPLHAIGGRASIDYLSFYLSDENRRSNLASKMEGSTGRQRLGKSVIENFLIPLPPLETQAEIARILKAVDDLSSQYSEEVAAQKCAFGSLLDKLMTGKLRIINDLEVAA